jgi:hypothetical protein
VVLGYDITILIEDPEFEPTLSAPIQHDLMGMEDDGQQRSKISTKLQRNIKALNSSSFNPV